MPDEKKTGCIKVWLAEPLELDLRRMAEDDDRSVSEFIGLILRGYVYGNLARSAKDSEGSNRGE